MDYLDQFLRSGKLFVVQTHGQTFCKKAEKKHLLQIQQIKNKQFLLLFCKVVCFSAIRQAYLQNGGNDPDVLAQMAQMQAEAQAIEDNMNQKPPDRSPRGRLYGYT